MKKYTCLFVFLCSALISFGQRKITVAQDGSGDYKTVQAAFDAIPFNNNTPTTVFIKRGTYKEKLHLDSTKDHVTITGEVEGTILTYNDHTGTVTPGGSIINTMTSQTFYIGASDVKLIYLTIENSSGMTAGQAVAVRIQGDKIFFLSCKILGFQDTLFTSGADSRQYYRDCFIEGSTDFIFGPSTALFDDCILRSKKNSHVTAASTPKEHAFGYVFRRCKLVADTGLNRVSLGRPWRPYASVSYIACNIDAHIFPEGWDNWKNPENEKTARYSEYKTTGSGASPTTRVSWSHQLNDEEVKQYTIENILRGWNPYGVSFRQSQTPWLPTGKALYN
jgi:pectinesterase